jgi:hypothetical protein
MMNEKPDIKDLIRTQRLIIERCVNAVYTLKGMYGVLVAREIHTKYNEARMKEMTKNEAKNDELDKDGEDIWARKATTVQRDQDCER